MRILMLIFPLLMAGPLSGQSDEGEGRKVVCRFLSFGGDSSTESVRTKPAKGEGASCPLPTHQFSKPVDCEAIGNVIRFVTEGDAKPAGTAKIPAGTSSAILIFVPNPASSTGGNPWRILVVDDSEKNFPDGGAFVANFHSGDIRFVIGEHRGALHAGDLKGYARPESRDTFNMAPVVFQFEQNGKWRIGNESALRFLPGMRYLILAYTDPLSKRPKIKTVQDFMPAAS